MNKFETSTKMKFANDLCVERVSRSREDGCTISPWTCFRTLVATRKLLGGPRIGIIMRAGTTRIRTMAEARSCRNSPLATHQKKQRAMPPA